MPSKSAAVPQKKAEKPRLFTVIDSPIGPLTLVSSPGGDSLAELRMGEQPVLPSWKDGAGFPLFLRIRQWLKAYFEGKNPSASGIPLSPEGTEFQKRVWEALRTIPYGEVTTYHLIASAVSSVPRATGRAVGSNPIAILIPCHRIIGSDGSLTGFAGGLDRKIFLLRLEKSLLL